MSKNICILKNIGTLCCSENVNDKSICGSHDKIFNVWLDAGGILLNLRDDMTEKKLYEIFEKDTSSMYFDFAETINTSELHNEYLKCFNSRFFGK